MYHEVYGMPLCLVGIQLVLFNCEDGKMSESPSEISPFSAI